jgi:superfamily II DNA or RNA helicase
LPDFAHLEFHRSGIGLVPAAGNGPDTAIYIATVPGSRQPLRSCTCATARRRTCEHLQALAKAVAELERRRPRLSWEERFAAAVWYRLAHLLEESDPQPSAAVRVRRLPAGGGLQVTSPAGDELACYFDSSPAELRLLERTGKLALAAAEDGAGSPDSPAARGGSGGGVVAFDRAGLLERLALFQLTAEERALAKHGFKTRRQTWEESFWHRLAYHCVREIENECTFHPAVETASGRFTLTCRHGGAPFVRVTVPRDCVEAVLHLLAAAFAGQDDLAIAPLPLRSILHVGAETRFDRPEVEVRPAIQAIQAGGEARYFAANEKFRYGNLVYLLELGVLAALERPGKERKFRAPAHLKLSRSQVPAFIDAHGAELAEGYVVLAEPLRGRRVWKHFDALAVAGEALARSWTWLDLRYGFGNESVSLAELLDARRGGHPYLETGFGWIDLGAPAFDHLGRLLERTNTGAAEDGAGEIDRAAGIGMAGAELGTEGAGGEPDRMRLPLLELLRLQAAAGFPVQLQGGTAAELARLLELRPAAPVGRPAGLRSTLRPYQEIGADWLRFLFENRLGGLLCDDMGLGKTHQAMALMLSLVDRGEVRSPFLVVSPTSVVSHWRNQLRDYAPGLRVHVHHGNQRSLPSGLAAGDVVITSYGVLRRDARDLARQSFALAVLDEAQHIKNPSTQGHRAAAGLDAEVRLGLSGTPVENSLADLKALFDLVLPGYLGSDGEFERRYGSLHRESGRTIGTATLDAAPLDAAPLLAASLAALPPAGPRGAGSGGSAAQAGAVAAGGLAELRRLIAPFVLRRSKSAVLAELPEKIEDLRTCALSDDQVKLYREAVAGRGAALARELTAASGPPPYLHIFALLNLLKQICDHPALALGRLEEADRFASGKWDLYREVVEECLASGLKVVVFSQYLGMIRLMERHLQELGIGHASLTGGSGGADRRGALVERFNRDPDCRVFLGSLRAGGTGIDLVGGSVVIHYDRWWNAAREDQATDRVHRIGQRRAVQVIKLIVEGTLEEKIAAIVERKRQMLAEVVPDDDPALAKIFTRDQLLELLAWPGGEPSAGGGIRP